MGILIFVLLFMLVIFVVAWLIIGAVIHVLSGDSAEGSFSDALGIAGWAYAPELVTLPISLGYAYFKLQAYSFDGSDAQQLVSQFEAAEAKMQLQLFPMVVFAVVTIWSVYILAHGVAKTHDVPVNKAAVPAVLVGIGSVILFLVG